MFKKSVLIWLICAVLSGCSYLQNLPLFGRAPDVVEVKKGDTLYSIAKRYDMSIDELIELNGIDSPDQLYVGQVLKMSANTVYTVKKGDTLASIARRYHTNYKALAQKNNIKEPYNLHVGQKIIVSASSAPVQKNTFKNTTPVKKQSGVQNQTERKTQTSNAAPVSTKRSAKFMWPVSGKVISSFGATGKGRKNDGINISAPLGTTVKAGDKGTVAYAGNGLKGFGNLILLKHSDGYITAYAHNEKILVQKGQTVQRGEKIATVGQTGGVNKPQLHFEVRAGKKAVNPRNYLP
ncbi:MAG: LysM peptidoglycan-binding domain-containing protein [Alphaproteobacteria bacterium]|nr:LysM peptidoglycan-binding domain-containing protein [Alphaproteobacteria bacterium]